MLRTVLASIFFLTGFVLYAQTWPSADDYLEARSKLRHQDQEQRFDKSIQLDSTEQLLNDKLVHLRQQMSKTYQDQHFFPPARYFFQSQNHIEQTKLYQVLRMMPKGGILHLHGAASGDADWVVNQVIHHPQAYVNWDRMPQKGQIRFFNSGQEPPGFEKAQHLAQSVPHFADSLTQLLTFDERMDNDSVDIWQEFEDIFNRLYGFVSFKPMFRGYFERAFEHLVEDGIQHVEIRGIFNQLYDLDHEPGYYNMDSTIHYFRQAEQALRLHHPEFSLKIIFTDLRFKTVDQTLEKLLQAYQLRQRYPNFIIGYDLVAEEDAGHSTLYFLDNWLRLDSLNQVFGVDMPLYLHDGESNWVSRENMYDAVLLQSRRIGHGFNLFRFPALMEEVKARDICLEINPISNQILGYIRDLRMHPGSTYLTRGVPCVISSDDPLIFQYKGLSYDFWEIFMAWELDLKALKQLTVNSLQYSGLNPHEKQAAFTHFNQAWNEFVTQALTQLD